MRVLLDDTNVLEISSIMYFKESFGYILYFERSSDGGEMGFEFKDMSEDEAQKRAEKIIREAFEKGFVDVSKEPLDMVI